MGPGTGSFAASDGAGRVLMPAQKMFNYDCGDAPRQEGRSDGGVGGTAFGTFARNLDELAIKPSYLLTTDEPDLRASDLNSNTVV